jgi:hypothetical protein
MISSLVRRAVELEIGIWRNLCRWIFRRPLAIEPGAEPFGYTGAVIVLLYAFIAVSVIEIPVLHLILPWRISKIISAVVSVWGLFWMIGILAGFKIHPHSVGASVLQVRHGNRVDLAIPWTAMKTIQTRRRSPPSSKSVQLEPSGSGLVLHVVMGGQTNVDIVLSEPMAVPLPKGQSGPITELRSYADDPDALVARAHQRLAAVRDRSAGRAGGLD